MDNSMPILLVPGLVSSPRIFAPVVPALWRQGPVTVANHIRDDNMGAIARRILAEAPPRFALAGHSMGGYIAFEIVRQAPERVAKLALINTQARPDTPEVTARRRGQIGNDRMQAVLGVAVLRRKACQRGGIAVDGGDRMPGGEQRFRHDPADAAGSAGQQHHPWTLRRWHRSPYQVSGIGYRISDIRYQETNA